MSHKTWGQKVIENREKNPLLEDDLREYRKVMEKDLVAEINQTVSDALKYPKFRNRDFFIQVVSGLEPIMKMPYTRCFARISCPYPACKEAVYKYHHITGFIENLWQIPTLQLHKKILAKPSYYLKHPSYNLLAKYSILMDKKELHKITDKENGYKPDAIILNKEEQDGRDNSTGTITTTD